MSGSEARQSAGATTAPRPTSHAVARRGCTTNGDGDNLVAHIDGVRENMRVCGIDAPEVPNFGRPGEPGGEAAAYLESLVTDRQVALYATPQGRDRYGRLVVVAVLPDGREVSCVMIAAGHAEEDARYSKGRYGECGR